MLLRGFAPRLQRIFTKHHNRKRIGNGALFPFLTFYEIGLFLILLFCKIT